jgi:adenylate kinase family enzyme
MNRIVILGPGGSGKSTLATQLSQITGLPAIELDKAFWRPSLAPTPREEWVKIQEVLTAEDRWILDGDLGSYDALEVRLQAADTIIFLDFSPIRCAWRALRRSRERANFWIWLLRYRQQYRPPLIKAIARYAPHAKLHVLRTPKAVRQFLADAVLGQPEP